MLRINISPICESDMEDGFNFIDSIIPPDNDKYDDFLNNNESTIELDSKIRLVNNNGDYNLYILNETSKIGYIDVDKFHANYEHNRGVYINRDVKEIIKKSDPSDMIPEAVMELIMYNLDNYFSSDPIKEELKTDIKELENLSIDREELRDEE